MDVLLEYFGVVDCSIRVSFHIIYFLSNESKYSPHTLYLLILHANMCTALLFILKLKYLGLKNPGNLPNTPHAVCIIIRALNLIQF